MTAVPAPGPMTNRDMELARSFKATSSASATLSLNRSTSIDALSALWASRAAYGPATEITASLGTAAGSGTSFRLLGAGSVRRASAGCTANIASSAARNASSTAVPRAAMTRSLAANWASASGSMPASTSTSRLAGVPVTTTPHSMPPVPRIARVPASSFTEST